MNFLGVGPMELIIVAVLAYLLLGPKKMGEAGKSVGRILREIRQQREEFTSMFMESVDLEDEPKSSTPDTPIGAVPQSSDSGGSSNSDGSSEEHDASAGAESSDGVSTRAADEGGGQDPASGSDRGSKREEDK